MDNRTPQQTTGKSANSGNMESQLRNSSGFQTGKMRLTGQGIRPPSRGTAEKDSELKFNIINLGSDELIFAQQMKADLLQIQEDIEKMDIDGRLRNTSNMEFMKPHISNMKKWISSNSQSNVKQIIEKQLTSITNMDIEKILESMQVKSADEGLKKILKQVSILEIMINKLTEFEILTFLQYDDTFGTLTKNQTVQNNKVNLLTQGLQTNKFQICFSNLERLNDLFNVCNKLNQNAMNRTGGFSSLGLSAEPHQFNLTGIKTRIDLIKLLEKAPNKALQEDLRFMLIDMLSNVNSQDDSTKSEALLKKGQHGNNQGEIEAKLKQLDEIKKNLEKDNRQLTQKIEKMNGAIEDLKNQLLTKDEKIRQLNDVITTFQNQKSNNTNQKSQQITIGQPAPAYKDDPQYWINLMDELRDKLEQRRKDLEIENEQLKEKLLEKNIKIENYQSQITDLQEKINDFNEWKNQLFTEFRKNFNSNKDYQDSYEKALLDEFERYKKGFDRKISSLEYELDSLKKTRGRNIIDLKQKLDKEIETKQLLLKKLSAFLK